MSDNAGEKATIEYQGKQYEVTPEAMAIIKAAMDAGLDQDAAFAVYKAGIGGALKATHKPKEKQVDVAELAQPTVTRALKRNQRLKAAVGAHFRASENLDVLTAQAGFGDGFVLGRGVRDKYVTLTRSLNGEDSDGVVSCTLKVLADSDLGKAAVGTLDAHREASQHIMAIVNRVAKNNNVEEIPTIRIELNSPEDVIVTQKRRARSGGGGSTGPRASYDVTVGDTIEIVMKVGGDEVGRTSGATAEELTAGLKEMLGAQGKEFYPSQWSRKEWWPKS